MTAGPRCSTCGAAMVPMILSSFCPNDCDRGPAARETAPHAGAVLLDLSEDIVASDGRTWRAWLLPSAHHATARVSDLPPSSDGLYYGRYIVPHGTPDERSLAATLAYSRNRASIGIEPGWAVFDSEFVGSTSSFDMVVYVRTR